MTDQITTPVEDPNEPAVGDADDEFPAFRFSMRNINGEDDTVQIQTPILGTQPFVLVTPDDGAILVNSSHLSLNDLGQLFGMAAATAAESPEVEDETVQGILELFIDAANERGIDLSEYL